MKPETFKKIEEIYLSAAEISADERKEFLDKKCGQDRQLRKEVELLLSFDSDQKDFLEESPDKLAAELLDETEVTDYSARKIRQFEISKKIGNGGMGTVYLANDTSLERQVAIKILDKAFSHNEERLRRFIFEAKAASALNHPNILTIHEIGEIDDTQFIATEFIEGETLRKILKTETLSINASLKVAIQIVSALDVAHKSGIIHRDIKPDNIMIRPDGVVKVLDFGIAKLIDETAKKTNTRSKTKAGTLLGTANYMSPEQIRGKTVDARTDLFSFGIVLYLMLTGKHPFDGETDSDMVASILLKEPESVDIHNSAIPVQLKKIVEKSLEKDKKERFQTAEDILKKLKGLRRNIEISGEPSISEVLENHQTKETQELGSLAAGGHKETREETVNGAFRATNKAIFALALGVFLIVFTGFAYWNYSVANNNQIISVAVMPFENETGQKLEYLSDGMTESLINSLSTLPEISVKSRSSVFRYKGKEVSPQKIGEELSVEAVLLSRFVGQDGQLILNLELVDTRNGNQIWGKQFKANIDEIISLQNDITIDVSRALKIKVLNSEERDLLKTQTANPDAYQQYLIGRFHWNKRTPEGFQRAITHFKKASEIDPSYALSYVALADCYVLLENFTGKPAKETLPIARAYARRAVEIDGSLPEAHATLALVLHRSWKWDEAEKEYKRAINFNPKYASVHHWYSLLLGETGRFEDALREAKIAKSLDPLSGIINSNLAVVHLAMNNPDSAIGVLNNLIEIEPNFAFGHTILGLAYIKKSNLEEGLTEAKKGWELAKESSNTLSFYGYALAVNGKRAESLKVIEELKQKFEKKKATGQNIARVYAGLDKKDEVFKWLEIDFNDHSSFLPYIRWLSAFDSIRDDSRYKDLLLRMDLI